MKRKKNKVSRIISIAFMMLAGGAVGYFGAIAGGKAAATIPAPVMIALAGSVIPAFLFVIAVHEGGHAWAGVRMNFDFRAYVVVRGCGTSSRRAGSLIVLANRIFCPTITN